MAKKIRVFVYGTLKQGYGNHAAIEGSKFLGYATITGPYEFVNLSWYPAVCQLPPDSPVREIGGEVYEVDHDTLGTLDIIEGHPSYYCREKRMTSLGNKAWVYMLPAEMAAREKVSSLFWRQTEAEQEWVNGRNLPVPA